MNKITSKVKNFRQKWGYNNKSDIIYVLKLFLCYPIAILCGLLNKRDWFNKMLIWLEK